jgi:hypothetical protein
VSESAHRSRSLEILNSLSIDQHLKTPPRVVDGTIKQGDSRDMSDRPEGTVADAGEAVQRKINQASEAQNQIETYIRDNPITAVLIAVGVGYVLGKIV